MLSHAESLPERKKLAINVLRDLRNPLTAWIVEVGTQMRKICQRCAICFAFWYGCGEHCNGIRDSKHHGSILRQSHECRYSCKYLCYYHKITQTTSKNSYIPRRTSTWCIQIYTAYFAIRAIFILYHIQFLHGKCLKYFRMWVHGLKHKDLLACHLGSYGSAPADDICGIRNWSAKFYPMINQITLSVSIQFVTYPSGVPVLQNQYICFVFFKLLNFFTYRHLQLKNTLS